jgi:hypothetical protein
MRYYILACLYVHFTSALSFFSFLTFSFCLRIWKDDIKNEKFVIVTRYLLLLRGGGSNGTLPRVNDARRDAALAGHKGSWYGAQFLFNDGHGSQRVVMMVKMMTMGMMSTGRNDDAFATCVTPDCVRPGCCCCWIILELVISRMRWRQMRKLTASGQGRCGRSRTVTSHHEHHRNCNVAQHHVMLSLWINNIWVKNNKIVRW